MYKYTHHTVLEFVDLSASLAGVFIGDKFMWSSSVAEVLKVRPQLFVFFNPQEVFSLDCILLDVKCFNVSLRHTGLEHLVYVEVTVVFVLWWPS